MFAAFCGDKQNELILAQNRKLTRITVKGEGMLKNIMRQSPSPYTMILLKLERENETIYV